MDTPKTLILFVPIVTGFMASYFCTIGRKAGSTVPWRPPAIVFSIVWPILYTMIGIAWYLTLSQKPLNTLVNYAFIINTILGVLWIITYGCGNLRAFPLLIIIGMIASALFIVIKSNNKTVKMLLVPYILWLIFATSLSIGEMTNK